jgi:pilin isopeptide linkage protein
MTKDLKGGVDFKPIEFTKAGTYVYTLQEVEGILANFSYDVNEYQVVVVVEDNYGTAQLEVKSVTIDGEDTSEWTITNIYKADPVDVEFTVNKVLNGMNDGIEPATFTFELTGDGIEEARTVKINGAGSATFDAITFEKTGTYNFEVTEVNEGLGGYIYDVAKFIIEVTVTDEGAKLVADVQIKKDGQSASDITFENSYEATPVTDYAISVKKELEGRELKEGEFSFMLYDAEGNEVLTTLNDADGTVTFDGLTFDEPGEYTFTVKENVDESKGDIEFDTNEYTITIVVKDDGEGALYVESDDSADVVFNNKWNEPGHGEDLPNPKTEDDIVNSIALMSMSIIGLIGAIIFGKRKASEEE